MSDGMAFLTGAAFAGVAVLFMLKGGTNIGATNIPPQALPISPTNPTNPTNPYSPYGATPGMPTPASPNPALYNNEQQRLDTEQLKAMLNQQRMETEQLKAQVQNQQFVIDKLTTQADASARATWSKPVPATPPVQQQENSVLSGIVWGLGGVAITISGGIVVVGALSVLSRQQRPAARTTYVVQPPYNALPHTLQPRRRAEVISPQIEERRVDYVEYDR